ncbi:TIGR03118 family protein [Kribbella capetownensis]|uniref:TIGR03118 family protein n=1 Tax=Kribbella capetownensis TaxID=1572659 RepID=A0A4R0KCZ3_9ACTN|nr:TIGR03118 family protein [Kribbella capetownensis]TCC53255.1 TIGR03118 family protein [Kribbella capetownensis]
MSLRSKGRPLAVTTALISSLALLSPATASAHQSHHSPLAVQQVNLVSDQAGKAALQDDDLVNPWGLSLGATTPVWASNNGTSSSTLYSSAPGSTTATKMSAVRVTMPVPTGQVNNPGTGFVLSNGTVSAPARFIFATETGQIAAWGPPVSPLIGAAEIKATTPGAVYKGLAIATARAGDQLYAANFSQRRIDVFDSSFMPVKKPWWAFRDSHLPKGFSPFNVQTLNGHIFVAYAKLDPKTNDEIAGRGLGFVDEYTVEGKFVSRVGSRGTLNAPWGMAFAPSAWGQPAGTLLVGNFGDGRINIFRPKSHGRYDFAGQVKNARGKTLVIDGLWALLQGTATTGGTDSLWFSAGPDDESHGLLGVLRAR